MGWDGFPPVTLRDTVHHMFNVVLGSWCGCRWPAGGWLMMMTRPTTSHHMHGESSVFIIPTNATCTDRWMAKRGGGREKEKANYFNPQSLSQPRGQQLDHPESYLPSSSPSSPQLPDASPQSPSSAPRPPSSSPPSPLPSSSSPSP